MMANDCGCSKGKPTPLGGGKPRPAVSGLIASVGAGKTITHIAPDGTRTTGLDALAAKAAVVRKGGKLEF